MKTRSKLDPNQISQYEHDDESGAKRVKLVDLVMSVELDADDGDSVQTQSRRFKFTPESGEAIDASKISQFVVYSSGSFDIEICPAQSDADGSWVSLVTLVSDMSIVHDVICERIRVISDSPITILARG